MYAQSDAFVLVVGMCVHNAQLLGGEYIDILAEYIINLVLLRG